jgi:hypothetical protein
MKKILFSLLFLLVSPLFSQSEYRTYNIQTQFLSTSKMIMNHTTNKWDFVINDDLKSFESMWTFYVNSLNHGTITNGNINYDILDYKQIDEKTIKISVYNLKVGRNMDLLIIKGEDSISIGVFDYTQRTAYYFLQ